MRTTSSFLRDEASNQEDDNGRLWNPHRLGLIPAMGIFCSFMQEY